MSDPAIGYPLLNCQFARPRPSLNFNDITTYEAVGDGSTNCTAQVQEADASTDPVLVSPGIYVTTLDGLKNAYHGDGSIRLGKTTHNLMADQAPLPDVFSVLGDMDTIDLAINNGAAKVVFWGDSITEGVSQCAWEDSFPALMAGYLSDNVRNVTWTFENYAIAGSASGDAYNASYIGAATDSYPTQFYRVPGAANTGNFQPGTFLWPAGSTNGKSWRDHVKDSAPDLLLIAFGANEVGTDTTAFSNNLSGLILYIRTWAKVPSIVFVSNLCATRKIAPWDGYEKQLRNIGMVTRTVATINQCSLIDANRLHHFYRDGIDVCRAAKRLSYNFAGGFTDAWPAGWESNGLSLPTVAGTYNLAFSNACVTEKQDKARDVSLSAVFVNDAAADSVFGIVYRSAGVLSADKYTAFLITNSTATASTMVLFHGGSAIASGAVAPVTNGEQVRIDVECTGARHIIKVRGAVSIDIIDYRKLDAGQYGAHWGAGSGVVANWVARVGASRVVGSPRLTDDHVYGKVNDWLTNDASLGGDTIHHPTAIGHYAIYFTAAMGLLQHLAHLARRPKNKMVSGATTNITTPIASGDYIEVTIAGASNGACFVTDSTADASLGASVTNIHAISGTSAVIELRKNGAMIMTLTLALTGGGAYSVIASGSVSSKGGVHRHTLAAMALKV